MTYIKAKVSYLEDYGTFLQKSVKTFEVTIDS